MVMEWKPLADHWLQVRLLAPRKILVMPEMEDVSRSAEAYCQSLRCSLKWTLGRGQDEASCEKSVQQPEARGGSGLEPLEVG